MPEVVFQPYNMTVKVEPGTTLLEAAELAGVRIRAQCGGQGSCGECKVEIARGEVDAPPTRHELPEGQHLACQSSVKQTQVEVFVPEESREVPTEVTVTTVEAPSLPPEEGLVRHFSVSLREPSLDDNTADAERLGRALRKQTGFDYHIALPLMQELPRLLRDADWEPNLITTEDPEHREVLDVCSGECSAPRVAAIDLGTTVIKGTLLGPDGGCEAATPNPQGVYGPDVITRIIYSDKHEGGLERLQELAAEGINRILTTLAEHAGCAPGDIHVALLSGNTTMCHLALGLCPSWIRREPYVACTHRPPPLPAHDLGLEMHPAGRLFCLPSVSSYVGADIASGVMATGLHESETLRMLIDLGTNGEIVVGNREFMACCSASAGPAFEGGAGTSGTWARPGAVSSVSYDGRIHWKTLDDEPPLGICGTGYIDLIASLMRAGVVDKTGTFLEGSSPDLREGIGGLLEYVLVPAEETSINRAIVLTQADLNNLVRAKGAIYAAGTVLLRNLGLEWQNLDRIMLAGGFGERIGIENAIMIGLLPDLPEEKIEFAGNTSLRGAVQAARSAEDYASMREIAAGMTYFELSTDQDYMDEFVSACFLPHTHTEDFPSVTEKLSKPAGAGNKTG